MKIALVHDYLTQRGGAERVFELLLQRYPNADIYTSLYEPSQTIELGERKVNTTFLQGIPNATKYFRLLAPLYYQAFRTLDLQDYDLIISSSTGFAKSVRKRPDAKHICFCHNVPRFLWDTKTYLVEYKDFQAFYPAIETVFKVMRMADLKFSQEPDIYIANSTTVARRILKTYNRPATAINYPIDTNKFIYSDQKEDFYLASARLLSYKRIDLIVKAFNRLGWPLYITGEGPEREYLESISEKNIVFLGYVSDEERTRLLSRAKAVIVAALEDYGLVPVEANASGTPVISYGSGGVLDTQVPGVTGLFFDKQSPESLEKSLLKSREKEWNHAQIHDYAVNNFTEKVFFEKVESLLNEILPKQTACLVS